MFASALPTPQNRLNWRFGAILATSLLLHALCILYVRWSPRTMNDQSLIFSVKLERLVPTDQRAVPPSKMALIHQSIEKDRDSFTSKSKSPAKQESSQPELVDAPSSVASSNTAETQQEPTVRFFLVPNSLGDREASVKNAPSDTDFQARLRNRTHLPEAIGEEPESESRKKLARDIGSVFPVTDTEVQTARMPNGQLIAKTKSGHQTTCMILEDNRPFGIGAPPGVVVTCPPSGPWKSELPVLPDGVKRLLHALFK